MARPNRRDVFDPTEVGTYHCVQRTVRRAFLCGEDELTKKSYEHRKQWIRQRLEELASIFSIDCLSFAVMSNHLHVMLRNRPDVIALWSDEEVARRWWRLFPKRRDTEGRPAEPTPEDLKPLLLPASISTYRQRLSDISWWMRALSEPIARRSNREDQCTGHFWEGRFKSQKLADESAILACTVYIDLNPIRAGIAQTPEESQYTSIYERIAAEQESRGIAVKRPAGKQQLNRRERRAAERAQGEAAQAQQPSIRRADFLSPIGLDERAASYAGAMPSASGMRASDKGYLPLTFEQYLQLVDWTGRQLRRDGKLGRIPAECEPILNRIGLSVGSWCDLIGRFGRIFKRVAGTRQTLQLEATKKGRRWYQTSNLPIEMSQV